MEDYAIGQSLLIKPDFTLQQIRETLQRLGWQSTGEAADSPLLKGEPEFASWTWHGRKPILIYSFNPVARLRVLDVATLPPTLRGHLVQHLPMLSETDVNDLLFDSLPRNRLLGLWALQETERLDLIPQTHRLAHDPDHQVAALAAQVGKRLESARDSRESLILSLVQLADVAVPLIEQLNNPVGTVHLKPTREELIKLFDPSLADAMIREVEQAYFRPPVADPGPDYTELKVTAANAGLLRWSNEFSDKFAQGYRNVSGWMQPQWIWLSWRWLNAQGGAVQYDGLVWVETRWVWLPKAYRMVSGAIQFADAPATLQ
ncbi:hypothetical protein BTA51_26575 [Hahella sp. CCB-MM4]|uniref:hypothetical protein n=1 Tax=Hahella sp. (strain CCB-MM4) TaxID=1926491 RepID=UPI000B9A4B60|nr:hypothetical protein [Hahella sp. CCB-MM4]OZG70289.1 hypothetical protein BTA51_26575 [Hahella sp. CCB-MM4]